MSTPAFRMLPEVTRQSEAFWTGGKDGQLLIYRCRSCGRYFHPPTNACFRCRSRDVGPEPVSGRAKVAAYTINVHPWFEGFPPPYVVAIVELSRATYRKMIQNLLWATGYNVVAIPLAAGALYAWGVLLTPALGAVLMSASTVIVAINARMLKLKK